MLSSCQLILHYNLLLKKDFIISNKFLVVMLAHQEWHTVSNQKPSSLPKHNYCPMIQFMWHKQSYANFLPCFFGSEFKGQGQWPKTTTEKREPTWIPRNSHHRGMGLPRKLTARQWKKNGWKTIVTFWSDLRYMLIFGVISNDSHSC